MPITVPSFGDDFSDITRGDAAAAAGHGARHDTRLAGNVVAEEFGYEPRIEIIGSAGRVADDEIDRFAAIEILDRIRLCRRAERGKAESGRR